MVPSTSRASQPQAQRPEGPAALALVPPQQSGAEVTGSSRTIDTPSQPGARNGVSAMVEALPAAFTPPVPRMVVLTGQQQDDLSAAITLLHGAGHPEYAAPDATITGGIQTVKVKDIWINPLYARAMSYTTQEVGTMVASMRGQMSEQGHNGQVEPIIVAPFDNPMSRRRSTRQQFMVIAGERRVLAADQAGIDYLDVIVRQYPSFYVATRASVTAKLSPQGANPIQTGALMKSVRIAHAFENQRRLAAGLEPLPDLRQEDLAESFCCDRSWVSVCERLDDQPDELKHLVSQGLLAADRLKDLLAIEDDAERLELANQWAALALAGQPVSRIIARKQVAAARGRGTEQTHLLETLGTLEEACATPPDLLLRGYPRQAPLALGVVLADAGRLLEAICSSPQENPRDEDTPVLSPADDPDLAALRHVLRRPGLQQAIARVLHAMEISARTVEATAV